MRTWNQRKAEKQIREHYLHSVERPKKISPMKDPSSTKKKEEISRRKEIAETFVGKKVLAGGKIGMGVRINIVSGCLVVAHATGETSYNPDYVTLAPA